MVARIHAEQETDCSGIPRRLSRNECRILRSTDRSLVRRNIAWAADKLNSFVLEDTFISRFM